MEERREPLDDGREWINTAIMEAGGARAIFKRTANVPTLSDLRAFLRDTYMPPVYDDSFIKPDYDEDDDRGYWLNHHD